MSEPITFAPRGGIRELFARHDPELIVTGPAGTGKSRGILELFHLRALKYAGSRQLFARKTRRSMTQSILVEFNNGVRPQLDGVKWRVTEQEYRYPNGSIIAVAGLDEPSKIFSTQWDGAYINEAIEVGVDEWESVSMRCRNGVIPYQQLVGDTNPGPPNHWIRERMLSRLDDGSPVLPEVRTVHRDNPRIYTDAGELTDYGAAYMARLERLTGFRRARFLLGDWVGAEGVVYDNWHESPETVRTRSADELASWRRLVALDVGVRNPTAILALYWSALGEQHIGREVYRAGMSAAEVVDEAANMALDIGAEVVLIDPSAAGYRLDLEAELFPRGIEVRGADNDRRRGVQLVREAIDNGLTVDPSCVNWRREMGSYHYREGSASDDPEKVDDHALDAHRYGTVFAAEPEVAPFAM